MKKVFEIAIALGILGCIAFAESVEQSTVTFLIGEAASFAIAAIGVIGYNKKTEAEASATMKKSESLNS